nr:MAG TPA: hypothetical protein [Caudoviricetes sp.]DAH18919.1 MAG TPA: hypothetical protein [Caudoviricetes sp.]
MPSNAITMLAFVSILGRQANKPNGYFRNRRKTKRLFIILFAIDTIYLLSYAYYVRHKVLFLFNSFEIYCVNDSP